MFAKKLKEEKNKRKKEEKNKKIKELKECATSQLL